MRKIDKQNVELFGRHALIEQLVRAGIEVALPQRDKGVDLIIYKAENEFSAKPIQLKASSKQGFSLSPRYEKIPGLIMAYVWNATTEPEIYAMTYEDAFGIAENSGFTKTKSWQKGQYVTTLPSQKLQAFMRVYRTTEESWEELLI